MSGLCCNFAKNRCACLCCLRSPKALSRRQKRRAYENRYWHNVLAHTRQWYQRQQARREREEEAILEHYIRIAEMEAASQPSAAEIPRVSANLVMFCVLLRLSLSSSRSVSSLLRASSKRQPGPGKTCSATAGPTLPRSLFSGLIEGAQV